MISVRSVAAPLVAGLLLAGCAAGPQATRDIPPTATTSKPPTTRDAAVAEPAASLPPVATTATRSKPDIRRLSIAMVGDMMLGTDFPENRLPDDDGKSFLSAVAPIISAADIAIGNLEGVLVDGGTPAKDCDNPAACYLFRSPPRYAQHFVDAGFDVLSLANNHARDFGEEGRTETMRTLQQYGILHSGREGDFASLSVHRLSVAVLAFAVTQESNLLHDYEQAAATIAEFGQSHDIVIVSFHGGAEGRDVLHVPFREEEYYGEPRGDVVRFARLAVDSGADLVFGHGPHVVRGMELYKDRLIAYSLGNFATYYGISVSGLKGVAPILQAELNYQGRFLEGRIHSTVQVRPGGPRPDPTQKALQVIRELSAADLAGSGLVFSDDGRLLNGQ
ncbi:MAG: CapA family protein [Woeseia sp.]